jgi:hypothetical protein
VPSGDAFKGFPATEMEKKMDSSKGWTALWPEALTKQDARALPSFGAVAAKGEENYSIL